MFDNNFIKAVKQRQYHYFGNIVDVDYDWYSFVKLLSTHPNKDVYWFDDKKRVQVVGAHTRPKNPDFSKRICDELSVLFPKNIISLLPFAGFTSDHKSLDIHRDGMDVLYLQVLGEVNWSIWEPKEDCDQDNIKDESIVDRVWERKFTAGDLIWIPRGVYHHVEPLGPRVGFSFGVEGKVDPSTYI